MWWIGRTSWPCWMRMRSRASAHAATSCMVRLPQPRYRDQWRPSTSPFVVTGPSAVTAVPASAGWAARCLQLRPWQLGALHSRGVLRSRPGLAQSLTLLPEGELVVPPPPAVGAPPPHAPPQLRAHGAEGKQSHQAGPRLLMSAAGDASQPPHPCALRRQLPPPQPSPPQSAPWSSSPLWAAAQCVERWREYVSGCVWRAVVAMRWRRQLDVRARTHHGERRL